MRSAGSVNFILVDDKIDDQEIDVKNESKVENQDTEAEAKVDDKQDLNKNHPDESSQPVQTNLESEKVLGKINLLMNLAKVFGGVIIVICIFCATEFYILWEKLALINIQNTQSSSTQTMVNSTIKTYNNILEVGQFSGNPAITDFGNQVDVDQDNIQSKDSPNCKLTTSSPIENNCYLIFSPSLAGLSKQNIIFTGISFEGSLSGANKINLDLIDNQNDLSLNQSSIIDSTNFSSLNQLPLNIAPNYSIRMTFWESDSSAISITKIKLSYLNFANMDSVSGQLNGAIDYSGFTGFIYPDLLQNQILDDADIRWQCTDFFPGVKQITFDKDGKFNLVRDDKCYTKNRSDSWSDDNGVYSLPVGGWFLVVFKGDQKYQTFPFKVQDTDTTVNLSLKLKS
jgi:hypothetical protein